jgi:hypothetical protein
MASLIYSSAIDDMARGANDFEAPAFRPMRG